ncbi:uncharacterized protein N7482_005195 [Penicillium canariense]|uniref:Leucine-rich repeat domain-containing protein n=1 Tax=Penicillium canariense TaxID=189055 RepID=A0A9W9I4H7_9EURO|nr:uncharacterized protein N7482_005195 [Penicillium canariense]KAJ5166414.1 hypothetical protein N7482_005195 [Penicillium canariense]
MVVLYDDIIFLIFDHIFDIKDRLQLLRVCRHWYGLLLPKVYESIRVEGNQAYGLVCSIQKNPEIGRSIRDLTLRWCYGHEANHKYSVEMFKDTLQQASPSIEHCTNWEKDLLNGEPDAWLALLTPSLEAVRSLELEYKGWSDYFFPMLARAAARQKPFDSKPCFQHLEWVRARNEHNKTTYYASEFLPLFHFPAMQVFSASSLCEEPYPNPLNISKPALGTSGITELDFGDCNSRNGMADYITSCANLEVFNYQHQNQAVWGEAYCNFHPLAFYPALYTQRHSLRVLRLNNNGEIYGLDRFVDDQDTEYSGFGSLAEFSQLRELRMLLRTLLQFGSNDQPAVSLLDVLPSSLEHLQLAGYCVEDFDVVLGNLQGMLAQRTERFPNLRRLEIQPVILERLASASFIGKDWSPYDIPKSVKQAFAPIKLACDELGIAFGFTKDGYNEIYDIGIALP